MYNYKYIFTRCYIVVESGVAHPYKLNQWNALIN